MRIMSFKIVVSLLFLFSGRLIGQNKEETFFHSEFVKENKLVVRLLPSTLKVYENYKDQIIEIQKFRIENGQKIVQGKPTYLKPFEIADTSKWMSYIRKNGDQAAFMYQYIYPDDQQKKNKSPNQAPGGKQQLFNLFLLNCDYSSDAATAAGLLFSDSLIDNQSVYSYSFSIGNKKSIEPLFEIKTDSRVLTQQPAINNFTAKLKKGVVTCKLDVRAYRNVYSAYYIEKSTDAIHFKKTTAIPYVYLDYSEMKEKNTLVVKDSTSSANPKYYYRVKGVNVFGEDSKHSNTIELQNYREIKSYPNVDTLKTILNKMVLVKWKMLDDRETPLMKNYLLCRSSKDGGPYQVIYQSKSDLYYLDKEPLASNFYKVMAITHYDDTLQSFSRMICLNDSVAPQSPKGLKAVVDKNGNVRVTWKKNTEQDVMGYRIFKANDLHEEFVSTTETFITDTVFTEKLPLDNLAHHLYYSVTASDKSYNTSAHTIPFKLIRPDTVAPVKPIITAVKLMQHGIKISFSPSRSDDVELHTLVRSSGNDKSVRTVFHFLAEDSITNFFMDTSVVLGENYTYTLTAFDEGENRSMSFPRYVVFETGYRPEIKNIAAKVDLEKRRIFLAWEVYGKDVEKYVVYRSSETDPYIIVATVQAQDTSFTDSELSIGNIYFYKIKAVLKNGAESIFNKPIKVIY